MAEGEVRQYFVRNDKGTLWGPLTLQTIELLLDNGVIQGRVQVSEDGLHFAFPGRFPHLRDAFPRELWGEVIAPGETVQLARAELPPEMMGPGAAVQLLSAPPRKRPVPLPRRGLEPSPRPPRPGLDPAPSIRPPPPGPVQAPWPHPERLRVPCREALSLALPQALPSSPLGPGRARVRLPNPALPWRGQESVPQRLLQAPCLAIPRAASALRRLCLPGLVLRRRLLPSRLLLSRLLPGVLQWRPRLPRPRPLRPRRGLRQ